MNNWTAIYNLAPDDRKSVALSLFQAGYTVRQRKKKDGSKTVIYLEYRKDTEER